MEPAGEQELLRLEPGLIDPSCDRFASLLRDLELYRPVGLLLHYHGPRRYTLAVRHIPYPQPHQIASPQLAVDG